MPDATSNYLNNPPRTEAEAERAAIARLKARFFELMDRRRDLQCSATGCEASVIAKQIEQQNAVLSEAAAVACEIDDRLGEQWDWLAEEATRGQEPADQSNVVDLQDERQFRTVERVMAGERDDA